MQQMISISSTPVVVKEQMSADLAGEAVIVNLKNGVYYGLDGVGYRIWSLIQEQKGVQEIRDTIVEEYEVEPMRLEQDLLGLLQQMADEGLIEVK